MAGTVVFQSTTLSTPGPGIVVAQDSVNGTAYQQVKIDVGPAGTSVLASYAAGTGLPVQGVGTFQALGTVQPLAGSVHLASRLPGTADIGTIAGTVQGLGTYQPLAGSVHLASRLPGTADVGTIAGTVSALGTVQPLAGSVHLASRLPGTVDVGTIAGTVSILGTTQPLAGSVHFANTIPGGSVSVQGYVAQKVPPAGNPFVMAAFGSSGTQAALADGSTTYLWADLNGRLQVRGTIDSIGTVQVLGSVQTVGTSQMLGTVQPAGTISVGTIAGTVQVLGTTQPLAGSVHPAAALPGTSQISGTVRALTPTYVGESFFGTLFTGGVTNGTLVPAPGAGTFVRVYDILVNGSAAGTAFLEFGDGTAFGPVMIAANGGYVFNSYKGVKTKAANLDILFSCAAGSWGVSVNYALET